MKKVLLNLVTIFSILLIILPQATSAATHTVKYGDTVWLISQKYGVAPSDLIKLNHLKSTSIYPGQVFQIPSVTAAEKDLLARLVRAEAVGEPYAGKVAVAVVVLNRVASSDFPDTIKGVIYETYENGKIYAFSPVENGEINKPADATSIRAVEEAIALRGTGNGSLFFYNPSTSTSSWITSRPVTVTIRNHVFAK